MTSQYESWLNNEQLEDSLRQWAQKIKFYIMNGLRNGLEHIYITVSCSARSARG